MDFEWDDDKRLTNIQKHGIDFVDAHAIYDGDTVTVEDERFDYGERRFVTLGRLQGTVVVLVHTDRSEATRIISVRKATRYEEQNYFEQIAD